jgi:hypothetical protein
MSPISGIFPAPVLSGAVGGGLAAIAAGSQQLSQDAGEIANPANGNLVTPLVDLAQAKLLAEAGAAVIRTSDQMLGSLLDTYA